MGPLHPSDSYGARPAANTSIDVWLRVVITAASGAPVANMATVFESKIGGGSLIGSGLDLDLQTCNVTTSTPSERASSPTIFSSWVAKALIDAAVRSVHERQ